MLILLLIYDDYLISWFLIPVYDIVYDIHFDTDPDTDGELEV